MESVRVKRIAHLARSALAHAVTIRKAANDMLAGDNGVDDIKDASAALVTVAARLHSGAEAL